MGDEIVDQPRVLELKRTRRMTPSAQARATAVSAAYPASLG